MSCTLRRAIGQVLSFLLYGFPVAVSAVQIFTSNVSEDAGTVQAQFFADDPVRPLTVNYATRDGTAKAGQDYGAQSGTLVWNEGDNSIKTVQISLVNDTVAESRESFSIVASYNANGTQIQKQAAIGIEDDDAGDPGTIGFNQGKIGVSEGGTASLRVSRNGGSKGAVSVSYSVQSGTATEGTDYVPVAGVLTWNDGEDGGKTIDIATLADDISDSGETFTVRLSDPAGGVELRAPANATVTILESAVNNTQSSTDQQTQVANAIDQTCGADGLDGTLAQRCQELSQLTPSQQQEAIRQITPTQNIASVNQSLKIAVSQSRNVQNRLSNLRVTKRTPLFNVNFNGIATPPTGGGSGDDAEESGFLDGRLGFFLQGKYQRSDKRTRTTSRGSETGFGSDGGSVTAGADYRVTDNFTMGLAMGYEIAKLALVEKRGSQDIMTYKGLFYGSYYLPQDYYIDWVAGYGRYDYRSRRVISYSGFSGAAKGSPTADEFSISLSVGKDIAIDSWLLSPYGRFEYVDLDIGEYRESGNTGWEMAFGKYSAQSLTTTAGARLSYAWSLPWGILTPAIRGEWLHEYSNGSQTASARLIAAMPGTGLVPMAIRSLNPDRDYFNIEGSIAATFPEGRSAFLRYESRLGQDKISSHTVEAGVRIPF